MVFGVEQMRAIGLQRHAFEVGHDLIVASARTIAAEEGARYARAAYPTALEPRLTGNREPGKTGLRWLQGHNKCNQFVGEALYRSGFQMPMFTMPDGSRHYMHAAALPGQSDYFTPILRRSEIAPGDIVVMRGPGRGENSAHVEIIVTPVQPDGRFVTVGAHPRGIEERSRNLGGAAVVERGWSRGDKVWYVLRPRMDAPEN